MLEITTVHCGEPLCTATQALCCTDVLCYRRHILYIPLFLIRLHCGEVVSLLLKGAVYAVKGW